MKKTLYRVLIVFFALVFVVSAGVIIRYLVQSYQYKQQLDYLQGLHGQVTRPSVNILRPTTGPAPSVGGSVGSTGPIGTAGPSEPTPGPTDPIQTQPTWPQTRPVDPDATTSSGMLVEMAELYKLNKDVVGYIYIEGTNINNPVLQRKSSKDYYLYKDIFGHKDSHGSIYAREACDVFEPSDNVTLYGHNMVDGTMFAHIHKYKTKSFFQDHPLIYFDTLYERHTYQVVCVFRTSGDYGVGFPYHQYTDFADEAEFKEFIRGIRKLAIHDSGIAVSYGDKFICLSTCEEWPIKNGRLVLLAVRIS